MPCAQHSGRYSTGILTSQVRMLPVASLVPARLVACSSTTAQQRGPVAPPADSLVRLPTRFIFSLARLRLSCTDRVCQFAQADRAQADHAQPVRASRPRPCRPRHADRAMPTAPCRPRPTRPRHADRAQPVCASRPLPSRPHPCRPHPCRPHPCRPRPCRPRPSRPRPCRPRPSQPLPYGAVLVRALLVRALLRVCVARCVALEHSVAWDVGFGTCGRSRIVYGPLLVSQ